jgi:hypothetical protein
MISVYFSPKMKTKTLKLTLIRTSPAFGGSTCTSSIERGEFFFQAMAAQHVTACRKQYLVLTFIFSDYKNDFYLL